MIDIKEIRARHAAAESDGRCGDIAWDEDYAMSAHMDRRDLLRHADSLSTEYRAAILAWRERGRELDAARAELSEERARRDEPTSYLDTITLKNCVPDTLTMTNSRGEAVFTITPDGMLTLGPAYKENPDAAAQEFIRIVMEMMPKAFDDRATLLGLVDRLSAELAKAKEALMPFARFLDVRENMRGLSGTVNDADSSPMFECSSSVNGTATLTAGDFRRARAALKDTQDE